MVLLPREGFESPQHYGATGSAGTRAGESGRLQQAFDVAWALKRGYFLGEDDPLVWLVPPSRTTLAARCWRLSSSRWAKLRRWRKLRGLFRT